MRQDILPRPRVTRGQVRSTPRGFVSRPRLSRDVFVRSTIITPESIEITETFIVEPAPMTKPIEHLSSEDKVEVLQRALARAQAELKMEHRSRRHLRRLTLTKAL